MSERTLITGASGFVGNHLTHSCLKAGGNVTALIRQPIASLSSEATQLEVNLLDAITTESAIKQARPDTVYHLAALASVGRSWEAPKEAIIDNCALTLNLLDALRTHAPQATVIIAGSGEVYGKPSELPVNEMTRLNPQSPYGVAKTNIEQIAQFYAKTYDQKIILTRPFNHSGPGQSATYVIASLTKQIAAAEAANQQAVKLVTGNASIKRDFTDVRDITRAYQLLAKQGKKAEIYNICSGSSVAIIEIIDTLRELTSCQINHSVDQALIRPNDTPEIRGSYSKLNTDTGWSPNIPLAQTLIDTLNWWRNSYNKAEH